MFKVYMFQQFIGLINIFISLSYVKIDIYSLPNEKATSINQITFMKSLNSDWNQVDVTRRLTFVHNKFWAYFSPRYLHITKAVLGGM